MKATTIGSMMQSLRHDVKAAQERVTAMRTLRVKIDADLKITKKIAGRAYGTAYVAGYQTNLRLAATIHVPELTSLKYDARLLRVLGRAIEFSEPKGSEDYVSDWIAERTFIFNLPNGGTLRVEARLKDQGDSGTKCRKIQTGVELKETPVYQILCE